MSSLCLASGALDATPNNVSPGTGMTRLSYLIFPNPNIPLSVSDLPQPITCTGKVQILCDPRVREWSGMLPHDGAAKNHMEGRQEMSQLRASSCITGHATKGSQQKRGYDVCKVRTHQKFREVREGGGRQAGQRVKWLAQPRPTPPPCSIQWASGHKC